MSFDRGLQEAYILHSRNFSDTSLILDLLTRHEGRYSVVVKGARSSRSKLKGRLQPFVPLLVASVGRGELKTSTAIDFRGPSFRLTGDDLLLGLYINELLYRLLGRFDPVEELFNEYEHLLHGLTATAPITHVRMFEFRLLSELGYGINFEYDARDGQPVVEDASYRYVVHEGFHQVTVAADDVYPGTELLAIASGALDRVDERRLKRLTRISLAELLGGKPLKSRTLFKGSRS